MIAVGDDLTSLPIGPRVEVVPALSPQRVEIVGAHVRLAPLDPAAHAEALFREVGGAGHDQLWLYMPDGPFADLPSFRAALEGKAASSDPLFFAIIGQDGACVGHAALMRIDLANRVIEVGNIMFSPALQRSVAATETLFLLMRYVFETLGDRRFEWKCNALNAPSRAAAARLGFTFEGIFRQHMIVKGRNRDTAWFSITDEEWPVRKRAFEEWLAPGNFDDGGRQKTSLSTLNRIAAEVEDLTLHRATAADVPAITALKIAAYLPNEAVIGVPSIPRVANYGEIVARNEVWVVRGANDLTGALVLARDAAFTIWSVAVSPGAQGSGVGRKLMAFAEQRARALGFAEIRLFTNEKLTDRIAWYGRLGYAVERVEDMGDRKAVHMTKTLGGGADDGTARG